MGRITIAVYRPRPGKDSALRALIDKHLPLLRKENLVTDRKPMVMRAADGTFVEIFEWASAEAIKQAHENPAVQKLWNDFTEACEYLPPVAVAEFQNVFAEFEPIN